MRNIFYDKLLPSQGTYCAFGVDAAGAPKQEFAISVPEVIAILDDMEQKNFSAIYVAPNSFDGAVRKSAHCVFSRSFFVDLDVGENKPYATKGDALQALDLFLGRTGLPEPIRIDSGGGIHAYWIFDSDVSAGEWRPYALKFKEFCQSNGLQIDPTVTADAARVMRALETRNTKLTPPAVVHVLSTELPIYDFEAFKSFLGPLVTASATAVIAAAEKGLDEDSKKVAELQNYEYSFADIATKSLTGHGCEQIRHILENAATLHEPLWRAGLSVARRCVDWESAIHAMSEDHPGYDPDATRKKADETLSATWAYSCDKFEQNSDQPNKCIGCPLRGKISSPIVLGRMLKEPEEQAAQVAQTTALTKFPASIAPFARGANGGVYFQPPPEEDEAGVMIRPAPIMISPYDIYPVKRMFSATDGACLLMRLVLPHDPTREFQLPVSYVYALDKFKERMMSQEALVMPKHIPLFVEYILKWVQHMIGMEGAEQMRMQMGWTEDRSAFVLGGIEVTPDGERPAAYSPMIKKYTKLMGRTGEYEVWRTAAQALNAPGFEMHAFALGFGFGSPLMCFTSTSGVAVSFTSEGSGNAKTGALYAGLSVFGNPKELSLLDGNATDNAFIGRYLALKNLMLGIDEASNARPEAIARLVHQLSQGKGKARMQSSVNAERELEQSASMIAMFTSNQPLYSKIESLKASAAGELARLVEFVVQRPAPLSAKPQLGVEIFDKFRTNYGHAGPIYIQHLLSVGEDYIRQVISEWAARFSLSFGSDVSYRFYQNLIAATFAGLQLADEAGILKFDLGRIYGIVLGEIQEVRRQNSVNMYIDHRGLLTEFMARFHAGFLILDSSRVVSEPRMALVGRIESDANQVFVSCAEMKKFLAEHKVGHREFEERMRHAGVLKETKKKRIAAGWKAGFNPPAVHTYVFETGYDASIFKHGEVDITEGAPHNDPEA